MEQALYELLEGINRAESQKAVYEAAMDFILAALRCEKVSILLFDDAGVMRFVAWRGLSDGYRQAVEGHSPWAADSLDAHPICVADLGAVPADELIKTILAEGIRALAFIPLTSRGKLLGKFMIYFSVPHEFTPDEVRLAQAIATQLAFAVQRQKGEEALRQSEERCRMLVQQVKDYAIFRIDTHARPMTWNEGVQRILGFTESEFIGRDVLASIFTPEDQASQVLQKELETAARTGSANNDRWLCRKDGSRFWAEGSTTALRNEAGELVGYSKVFRDCTERKLIQSELTSVKDRLAADLKAMTRLQALGARAVQPETDVSALFVEVLEAAVAIARADRGNVQLRDPETGGLRIMAQRGFEPSFLKFFQHVVDETAACAVAMGTQQRVMVEDVTKSPIFEGTEALRVLLEADVRAVQSTPLLSREGKVLGIISTHFDHPHRPSENELHFLDILARQASNALERTQADEALREAKTKLAAANEDLDKKVKRRTESLNETLHSLETLLYTIAHDLRAPNRAMQGYAHLLLESHSQSLNDEGRFYLQRIIDGALRNEALIRDLLEFGRLVHADFPCHALDPAQNVRAVLHGLESEIAALHATVEAAGEWPKVIGNDAALSHVLTNLVSNALKYRRSGVVPQIRIYPELSGQDSYSYVRLCVQDNGIGVPAEQQETIFQLFQRASNVDIEGTGMGLAIVRKAAERMGGDAGVDSKVGEGSTFWVELRKASSP